MVHIVFIFVYLSLLLSYDPLYLLYYLSTFLGHSSLFCAFVFLTDVGEIVFSLSSTLHLLRRD